VQVFVNVHPHAPCRPLRIKTKTLSLYSAVNLLLINTKRMSPLKAWGLKHIKQNGRKRATVAAARKLTVIFTAYVDRWLTLSFGC